MKKNFIHQLPNSNILKKTKLLVVSFILLLSISFLSCEDLLINPEQIHLQANLIKNPSFEINGKPSFNYWNADSVFTGFSTDTPVPYSRWSAALTTFDPRLLIPIPVLSELSQTIKLPHNNIICHFSFWAKLDSSKSGSAAIVNYKNGMTDKVKGIEITDSSWKKYTLIDTLSSTNDDSVIVQFLGIYSDYGMKKLLIDVCTLTAK